MAISYQFINTDLLREALTHPSFTKGDIVSVNYERLEFFGDSILSMVITEILYRDHKGAADGNLSIMHSNLVNSQSLAKVAMKIGLGDLIIMDDGEASSGGRQNIKNLENAMEALIAAVYLDAGYEIVFSFIKELWSDLLNDGSILEKDKKSLLQEWAQKNRYDLPIYETIKTDGLAHSPVFTISVKVGDLCSIGVGRSKKEAEQNAAALLLEEIHESERDA